jgi:hypothetical protein
MRPPTRITPNIPNLHDPHPILIPLKTLQHTRTLPARTLLSPKVNLNRQIPRNKFYAPSSVTNLETDEEGEG